MFKHIVIRMKTYFSTLTKFLLILTFAASYQIPASDEDLIQVVADVPRAA